MEPLETIIQGTIDGQRWIVRTNGPLAIASPNDVAATNKPLDASGVIRAALETPLVAVDRGALSAFCCVSCGLCGDTGRQHCELCDGRGTERANCSDADCSHAHLAKCRTCKGLKSTPCNHRAADDCAAPGRFDNSGGVFDRRLVAAAVSLLPPGAVATGTHTSRSKHLHQRRPACVLVLRVGDHLALVMEYSVTKRRAQSLPHLENAPVELQGVQ